MTDLPPLSHVLTLDCSNIQWITPVYGFLGSTINQSINKEHKRDKVTGEWRRVHNEELNDLYSSPKNNVMGGSCRTNGGEERHIQGFGGEILVKETTWKTEA